MFALGKVSMNIRVHEYRFSGKCIYAVVSWNILIVAYTDEELLTSFL